MAKLDTLSNEQREVIRAQNDALLRLPDDLNARLKLIEGYRQEKARENDLIAQAKKDVGSNETLKKLTTTHGYTPQAIKFINVLIEMPAEARSRTLRQVLKYGDDAGFVYPDLFDKGAVGVGTNDEAGETAGFDKTGEGGRRGGGKAQPRTPEQMAASHAGPEPTPGIPLDEAERLYEQFLAANPPKRGAMAKAVKEERDRLLAQIEQAKTAQAGAGEAEAAIPDLPEAKPGEITEGLRTDAAASEAHIRGQASGPGAPPPEAESPTTKPKRASRKKASAEAAAPPPPPAPPAEGTAGSDEEEDDTIDIGGAAARPDSLGAQPATFRVG